MTFPHPDTWTGRFVLVAIAVVIGCSGWGAKRIYDNVDEKIEKVDKRVDRTNGRTTAIEAELEERAEIVTRFETIEGDVKVNIWPMLLDMHGKVNRTEAMVEMLLREKGIRPPPATEPVPLVIQAPEDIEVHVEEEPAP